MKHPYSDFRHMGVTLTLYEETKPITVKKKINRKSKSDLELSAVEFLQMFLQAGDLVFIQLFNQTFLSL